MLFNNSKNIYLFIVIATFLSGQSKYQEVDKIRDELQLFDPAYQGSIKLPYIKTFTNFNPLMKENDEFGIEFFDSNSIFLVKLEVLREIFSASRQTSRTEVDFPVPRLYIPDSNILFVAIEKASITSSIKI